MANRIFLSISGVKHQVAGNCLLTSGLAGILFLDEILVGLGFIRKALTMAIHHNRPWVRFARDQRKHSTVRDRIRWRPPSAFHKTQRCANLLAHSDGVTGGPRGGGGPVFSYGCLLILLSHRGVVRKTSRCQKYATPGMYALYLPLVLDQCTDDSALVLQ